jgi:DnaK suppressor protein
VRQLTSSDLEELENRLREQRDEVLAAIRTRLSGRDEDEQRALINYFSEGDSGAAASRLAGAELALLRQEVAQLDAIDVALKRFDFGVGGLCIECGEPIPLERLRAAPSSLTCPDCQRSSGAAGGSTAGPGT